MRTWVNERTEVPEDERVLRFDDPRRAWHLHGNVFAVVRQHGGLWLASVGVGRRTLNLPGGHEVVEHAARAALAAGADMVIEANDGESGWDALDRAIAEGHVRALLRRHVETAEEFAKRRPDRVWTYEHRHEGGETGRLTAVVHSDELVDVDAARIYARDLAELHRHVWRSTQDFAVVSDEALVNVLQAARHLGVYRCGGCR